MREKRVLSGGEVFVHVTTVFDIKASRPPRTDND
jgi:hypothetical protein